MKSVFLSNFIKSKIKDKSFSNKEYVQYILELSVLDDYLRDWIKVSYEWFGIDYLRKKYLDEYIELIKEVSGAIKSKEINIDVIKNSNPLCKWIQFNIEQKKEWWISLWWIL